MRTWLVRDVMTTDVTAVTEETSYRDIVNALVERRVSAVPVVDAFQHVVGVVSEADLMHKVEFASDNGVRHLFEGRRQRTARTKACGNCARDLMTTPAITVLPDAPLAVAARRMDEQSVKRLPVTDELGRLVGIVTRSDLLRMYRRPDEDIRRDVAEEVLRRSLWLEPGFVHVEVDGGVVRLGGVVDTKSLAEMAVRLTRAVAGVVDVVDELTFEFDDTKVAAARGYRSHPFSAM